MTGREIQDAAGPVYAAAVAVGVLVEGRTLGATRECPECSGTASPGEGGR